MGLRLVGFPAQQRAAIRIGMSIFLADIVFMKKASVDDPNFEAYPSGTLVIKNFRPIYDERNFILLVRLQNITSKSYIYRPTINKGSPKLILVSPQDIYVYVRMDLYLAAQVEGYPYPWVSLSHDQHVLQNRSNFTSSNILLKVNSNITKANCGLYIICAGNPYGNPCLIMRVHVQGDCFSLDIFKVQFNDYLTQSPRRN